MTACDASRRDGQGRFHELVSPRELPVTFVQQGTAVVHEPGDLAAALGEHAGDPLAWRQQPGERGVAGVQRAGQPGDPSRAAGKSGATVCSVSARVSSEVAS